MTQPGDHVGGRYRLVERIGSGAMGVVWRAVDERLGRTVAVKQLVVPAALDDAEAAGCRERALREGRIAARLNHPNTIAVFDVADQDETPWLVMEYLDARSLAAVLAERGVLPPTQVAAIGRQLAEALAAAHAAGIVHRDIKPGNVLLTTGGAAKLTDFGISRAVDDVTVTRTGVLSGTPAYLAPEVARGGEPTCASDVFSLGATLYTAVEGQPPFGLSDNALALLHEVARGQVLPPREAGPLTDLLLRLLRADPTQRPTMAEARDALARIEAGEQWVDVDSRQAAEDEPPMSRRRRPALLVAAGVALAVLAGLLVLAATTRPERPVAQAPLSTPTENPAVPVKTAAPTTSAPPTTTRTSTPQPTTTRPSPPSPVLLQRAVADYYTLLPKHPEQAWAKLGPTLQAQGYDSYVAFWRQVDAVEALPTRADTASMTVRVLVVYRTANRRLSAEAHDLTLIQSGGALLINGDNRIAAAGPATTRKRGRG